MQRLLSLGPFLLAPSSISGRLPSRRAMAYIVWTRASNWRTGRRTPPHLGSQDSAGLKRLEEVRADAIRVVRRTLLERARAHRKRAQGGETVQGVVLSDGDDTRILPAAPGWRGLPGLFSGAWPTPVEEEWLDRAQEAEERGVARLVAMDVAQLSAAIQRIQAGVVLDEAAIAEEVASRYPRERGGLAAERSIERALAEAAKYEYRHLGGEPPTGRRPLPK